MTDELIVCRGSILAAAIQDAVTPIVAERNHLAQLCQEAIDMTRNRTEVLEVVWAQNFMAREALKRLLDDNEHAKHNCGDPIDECPVAFARYVLRGPVKQ